MKTLRRTSAQTILYAKALRQGAAACRRRLRQGLATAGDPERFLRGGRDLPVVLVHALAASVGALPGQRGRRGRAAAPAGRVHADEPR